MQLGYKKLFDSLTLMIEAWEMLGLNIKSPEEYENLKLKRKQIGEAYGWK